MSESNCPRCGTPNRNTAKFCSVCGEPFLAGVGTAPPPEPEPVGLPPDTVLQSRYQIEKELGRGGFGAVYRAYDLNLNRACALKENLSTTADAQRQFFREASALANLSHPNLPRVTDHFSVPKQGQYLVMDFIDGEDLTTKLPPGESAPLEEGLKWIIQVADALEYMHSQSPKVLHRDVKPANIRVTPAGKAVLVDFGLVKLYQSGHLKTTIGARAITPGYAPPEQYGMGTTDARTDVYALGATAYRILTGVEPVESVQRMSGKTLLPPQMANAQIPAALSQVIEKAMAMEPDNRYASMTDFIVALRNAENLINQPVVQPVSSPMGARAGLAPTMVVSEPVPSQPRPAPSMGTVVVDATPPPPSQPVSRPRSAPTPAVKKSGSNKTLVGVGIGVVVLICVLGAVAAVLGYNYFGGQTDEASDIETQTALERTSLALEDTHASETAEQEALLTEEAIAPTETPRPTDTPQAPDDTEAPEPTATQAEIQPTATPVNTLGNPDASVSGEVFFETEFENADNWSLLTVPKAKEGEYKAFAQGGQLYMEISPKNITLYAFYDLVLNNPDVYVETYAQKVAGPNTNNLSVMCRATDQGWYEFSMTSGGYWFIWRYMDEKYSQLTRGATRVINMQGEPNTVAASCIGTTLTFYVNGKEIGSVTDRTFTGGGQVGVSVFAEFTGLGVEFEYFKAVVP